MSEFYDWDNLVLDGDDDNSFTVLDPGTYDFKVKDLEKSRSKNGTAMAILTLDCWDDKDRHAYVKDYLVLSDKTKWKLNQFFLGIGQKKHGESLRPNWDKVPGATGRVKLKIDSYVNDKGNEFENNKVDRYFSKIDENEAEPGEDEFSWD